MPGMENRYNGVLIVNKEKGYTSNDVVAVARGILKMRKIGHTGTLDPDAEGVLPLCLGNATKLISIYENTDKEYSAEALFGVSTDTEDMTGNITERVTISPEEAPGKEEVERALSSFIGGYDQIPPMYSAKKVNGKKLYELAREGKEIERRPSFVKIYDAKLTHYNYPHLGLNIRCGKGTYIRSLIRDLGKKLSVPLTMESLIRTEASGFGLEEALTLDEVKGLSESGGIAEHIVSIESLFQDLPEIRVKGRDDTLLRNGNVLKLRERFKDGDHRVYTENGEFAALYTVSGNTARLKRMFL